MYDAGKIIPGLILFVGAVTFPVWYNGAAGGGAAPALTLPKDEKRCVESKEFMRTRHMELLNDWRDSVVRADLAIYTSRAHGTKHQMKLTGTCMSCHTSRAEFCDRCHNYLAVAPYCWDCHVEPGKQAGGGGQAAATAPGATDQ